MMCFYSEEHVDMAIYDISQEMFTSNVYPGDPVPEYERIMEIAKGEKCNLSVVKACAHNSTHIDAPYHFLENGKTIEQLDLKKCIGKAVVVEKQGKLTKEDMEQFFKTTTCRRLILKGDAEITIEAAEAMAEAGLQLLGVENCTVGNPDTSCEVHKCLLTAEIIILEGIVLREVPEGEYFLMAAPIKYGNLDGAPCRPVLMKEIKH